MHRVLQLLQGIVPRSLVINHNPGVYGGHVGVSDVASKFAAIMQVKAPSGNVLKQVANLFFVPRQSPGSNRGLAAHE
jgi:hypothetical protein